MSRLRFLALPLMAGLLLAAGGQARGSSIVFGIDATPDPVLPGGTVIAHVYLKETGGSLLATDGIVAADFKVTFSNATFMNASVNSGFDLSAFSAFADYVSFSLLALSNPPVTSNPATPEMLWLGSVELTAGASGWVSVGVQVLDPQLDNVVAGDGSVLDGGLGSPAARLAIVPEPASAVLLSLGTIAGLGLVRRRRIA